MPIKAAARPLFADLADRVNRVDRVLDNLGDGLSFAFEAGMLIEQAKQTETTRRLAAWAAILAVPTAIAIRVDSDAGSGTSQSALTRARVA